MGINISRNYRVSGSLAGVSAPLLMRQDMEGEENGHE